MKLITMEILYPKLEIVNGNINYLKIYPSQMLNGNKKDVMMYPHQKI
jgi:hypothetical protein